MEKYEDGIFWMRYAANQVYRPSKPVDRSFVGPYSFIEHLLRLRGQTRKNLSDSKEVLQMMAVQFRKVLENISVPYPSYDRLDSKKNTLLTDLDPTVYKLFVSKEEPKLFGWNLSDNSRRGFIIKSVKNGLIETRFAQIFSHLKKNFLRDGSWQLDFDFKYQYRNLREAIYVYDICMVGKEHLIIEQIKDVDGLSAALEKGGFEREVLSRGANDRRHLKEIKQLSEKTNTAIPNFYRYCFKGKTVRDFIISHKKFVGSLAFWSVFTSFFGIGDRNLNNIMLSKTGSVLHIDFECVFDIGKSLPVPEIVDIRLSPLFQAILGPSWESGPFKHLHASVSSTLPLFSGSLLPELLSLALYKDTKDIFFQKNMYFKEEEICKSLEKKLTYGGVGRKTRGGTPGTCSGSAVTTLEGANPIYAHIDQIISIGIDKDNLENMFRGWEANI